MRSKGLDPSHLQPKAIDHIPNLEHYHVIIGVAHDVLKAFPPGPRKAVMLDWSVADPSRVSGTAEQRRAAYESTYEFLKTHLQDLVEAIVENTDD